MAEMLVRAPFDPPVFGATFSSAPSDAAGREGPPAAPRWLRQVHGAGVVHVDDWYDGIEADAAWTNRAGQVAAIRTADCLPILIAEVDAEIDTGCVAAVHAGWRGLAAGVIEAAVVRLPADPGRLAAWIGPRICAACYEVGADVRDALAGYSDAFAPGRQDRWQADLPAIARAQLRAAGIGSITDSGLCTAEHPKLSSARRDAGAGRMVSAVWLGTAPVGRQRAAGSKRLP